MPNARSPRRAQGTYPLARQAHRDGRRRAADRRGRAVDRRETRREWHADPRDDERDAGCLHRFPAARPPPPAGALSDRRRGAQGRGRRQRRHGLLGVLLQGVDEDDPLFLQVKEAKRSVLAPYVDVPMGTSNEGQRVVMGQRATQGSPDIFLGWGEAEGKHFYVRQLADMKGSATFAEGNREGVGRLMSIAACAAGRWRWPMPSRAIRRYRGLLRQLGRDRRRHRQVRAGLRRADRAGPRRTRQGAPRRPHHGGRGTRGLAGQFALNSPTGRRSLALPSRVAIVGEEDLMRRLGLSLSLLSWPPPAPAARLRRPRPTGRPRASTSRHPTLVLSTSIARASSA